jgi:hypothetical protein
MVGIGKTGFCVLCSSAATKALPRASTAMPAVSDQGLNPPSIAVKEALPVLQL